MDRGQFLIRPPLFDVTNYAYWKVRMRAFLQSLDEKVWQATEIGQTKPKEALADWDDSKIKMANFNSRALSAIFSAVTNEEFKKISSTEIAKEAWTILQATYEGTKAIKDVLVDNTVGNALMSFMDGFSGYNKIKMVPKDMTKITFTTEWGI